MTVSDAADTPKPLSPRLRKTALRAARVLIKRKVPGAGMILRNMETRDPEDPDVMEAMSRFLAARGDRDGAKTYAVKALRRRGDLAVRGKERAVHVARLLRSFVGLEGYDQTATLAMSRRLHELMATDSGRAVLAEVSGPVLERNPDSVLMVYARCVALAKGGNVPEALAIVNAAMERARIESDGARSESASAQHLRRFTQFGKIWRVVDAIARDEMTWGTSGETESDAEADTPVEAQADGASDEEGGVQDIREEGGADAAASLIQRGAGGRKSKAVFTEHLIQGRRQDKYLEACKREYEHAETLTGRIGAIRAMLRQGLRRLPTYHQAYKEAGKAYEKLRPEWRARFKASETDPSAVLADDHGIRFSRDMVAVLKLADQLGYKADVEELADALVRMSHLPGGETSLWGIAAGLVTVDPDGLRPRAIAIVKDAPRKPKKAHEVKDYFTWALRARAFKQAHGLYRTLSPGARRDKGLTAYVNILQREGRFDEAAQLSEVISATMLARSRSLDPFASWTQIQRTGGLRFVAETAAWYSRVPQPKKPKGVIMVAPRNILQLRKYPLAVLMDLKRLGWAVVPLVEGMLPLEPTGNKAIDQFLGCTQMDVRLSPTARRTFAQVTDFTADLASGRFNWGDIDLSHGLFEEAAINRRRFTVDYTCPSLQAYLQRLVNWTELNARVLEHARDVFRRSGLRTGVMTLNMYRLPDAVNRFFCEQRGDPTDFFCIHAANGYENYFANFSTPISTKAVVRNMTMHPELRTASFPPPDMFNAWYEENAKHGPEMLERVRDITKVKRSTGDGGGERSPEAQAAIDRIKAWKAAGGKVACAFGKVVCDLAVPHDGGPAHKNLKDWLNHTIEAVKGSDTLLLIKPHPHEKRNEIGTFLTEYLEDLIHVPISDNVMYLGHDWFDIYDLNELIDLGLLYNGTTAIELGLLNIPVVLCSDYGPIDYPIGHAVPQNRAHYRRLVRFEDTAEVADDLAQRAAGWIHYLSGDLLTVDYRYHARPITNRPVYPPWWYEEDVRGFLKRGDPNVRRLAERAIAAPTTVLPTVRGKVEVGPDGKPLTVGRSDKQGFKRSKNSQGRAWQKIDDIIKKLIATRPHDQLATFLAELRELDIGRKDPNHFYRQRPLVTELGARILQGAERDLEQNFYYPDVVAGRYRPSTISPIRYLMNCVRKDTTAIVELGSGWSVNLFQIYVGLGRTRCKDIDFHGAEYTDEGQHAALALAKHDKKIRYSAHSFDYKKPDISFLEKYDGHVLVFTRHSIEQVAHISPKLYDMLHALKAKVTLVHIEPTGWQRDPELIIARKTKNQPFFEAIAERIALGVNDPRRQMENAAWWSWRLDYNVNLTAMISAAYRNGVVKIVRREHDFAAVGNVLNPSSLYHLEFLRTKVAEEEAAPETAPESVADIEESQEAGEETSAEATAAATTRRRRKAAPIDAAAVEIAAEEASAAAPARRGRARAVAEATAPASEVEDASPAALAVEAIRLSRTGRKGVASVSPPLADPPEASAVQPKASARGRVKSTSAVAEASPAPRTRQAKSTGGGAEPAKPKTPRSPRTGRTGSTS